MDIYNRTELARTKAHEQMYFIDNDVSRSCLPLHSCRSLLVDIKDMFDMGSAALSTIDRVQAWRKELTDIEKKLIFPKTVIAVVGETGAGKSSLLNALLDCSVLPTSGIRACTAAVVEVVQNTDSSFFEADIEFLQTKEWFDELEVLLKDLTALDGTIKKGEPNPDNDAYASYCKVLAVYGRVEPLPVLTRITTVTHWLGKVNVLKSDNAEDFRRQVETFIETQDPGSGDQFWPIVKHVRLRLPHCKVCSSGAALVDLPGVRDSNAARDRIAKEYLKNCTAVWVVSSIPRAIDRKTANDLLGESFHRQLVMDGQSGSIAFICTKTDILNSSEIIRSLKLDKETRELKTEIKALEKEKADLDLSVANRNLEHKRLQGTIKELETDVIESQRQEAMQKTLLLKEQLVVLRKSLAAFCANARNQYSKAQIQRVFKAGLREMKRRAGMTETDDPDEVDDMDDDNDDDNVGSSADNLRVFCCSATEYQKMSNLLTDDGPPQVFSTPEETQIPMLRDYVIEMTSIRQRQHNERLSQSLGIFVSDILLYASHDGKTGAKGTKSVVDNELQKLEKALEPIVGKLSADMDATFGTVRQKMEEGASNAASEASNTCAKWSAPVVSGGLHHHTYLATTRRKGVFNSQRHGELNFNEDLAKPMYRCMTIVLDWAFSGMLWQALDTLKTDLMTELSTITSSLGSQLGQMGADSSRCARVARQLLDSVNHKLSEMVSQRKDLVTRKQRDISRIVTPHIQISLFGTYDMCASESGPGSCERCKTHMSKGIERERHSMFNKATENIMQELLALQKEVIAHVKDVCDVLLQDIRAAYEPLFEAHSIQIQKIRAAFLNPISKIAKRVEEIGFESHDYPNADEGLALHGNNPDNSADMNGPGMMIGHDASETVQKQLNTECDGGPEVMKFVGGVKRKETAAAEDKSLTPAKTNTPQVENGKTATIGDKCSICSEKVYLLERQIEGGKLYHRACFRSSELSPTSKVFKRHSVDKEKDLPEQKHRKLELNFDSPEKKPNFWQQHNQTQAKQDDASNMEVTVNNVNKANNNEDKLSENALPIKDVQKKQDAASVISKVLPGFGSDAATNEAKLPKRNKVNIAEKLKELEEQNLKNATAANAAVFKNSDNKAGVSDKSSVLGKDTQSKSDIASQPKPKPRVHVASTSEKMDTDEPVAPSQPKPVPRFLKSSEVASPQSTPIKEVSRSKSPVEHREKKITPPMRPKTQFISLKDTNTSTESGSSLPPLPSSSPPKLPDSQTPKLSHHKKITIVSPKASSKQLSPIDDMATSSGTNASGFALHKPPSKPPRVTTVLDNQSNVKPMDINEIHEPAKVMNKDPAIGKSVALDVPRPEEKEKEVKGGLLKSLADVRNKQETVGDVKTGGVKTRVFTKIGEKSDSSHNFSAGTESSDKKLDSAKTQPPRPKSAFVPSASSLTTGTSVSASPGVTQVTTTTKTTTKTKVFHNYKKSEPSNGIEVKTETSQIVVVMCRSGKRKLEEKNMQKDRPKSADLLIDKPQSDVQVFHNYKKSEPSNGIEGKTETNKSDSVSDVPEWKRKLEEKNMQKDRPKSADLLIVKPKSDVQVLDWQKEAEKRKEARKGSYVDPEIGPSVINVNNNNKHERSDNVIQSNEQLRKPARPKTEDVSDEHIPKRPEKGPTIPKRPKTQADMIKTSPKISDQNNRISEPTKSPERRKILVSDTKFNGTEVKDEEVHKKKITVDTKFKFEVIDSKKGPEKPPAPSVLAEMPKSTKPHPARPPPPAANTSPKLGRQHISPEQIQRQLRLIDSKLTMLEIKGRKLEDTIRNVSEEDDELMISWFQLVNEKNDLVRMENDFIYLNREQELEIEQDELELHLRRLVETPEDQKTDEDRNEEEELIEKKMEIINQRNKIVDCIDQDRLRYLEEDHEIEAMLKMKGLSKGKKLVR